MSGSMYGADIEALRLLADKFNEGSETLGAVVTAVETAMPQVDAWSGPDGEGFRDEWSGTHLAKLRDTATALTDVAAKVRANADAQETTSNDYSGNGAGAGVGAGAAAGAGAGSGGGGGSDSGDEEDGGPEVTISGDGPEGEVERNNSEYTSERHGTYDENGNFTPSGTDADGNPIDAANGAGDPNMNINLAEGGVDAFAGAQHGDDGEFGSEDGAHGSGEYEVRAGAGAEASGSVGLNENGLTLEGAAGVEAGAGASASGEVGYGDHLGAAGSAEAFVGGRADVEAGMTVGPEGLGISAGGEAFIGAEAGIDGSVTAAGVTAGASGEVYAGLGVKADADIDVGWDNVGVDFELGAALGVGAGFSVSLDVSPADTVDAIADAGGALVDAGGDLLDGAGDLLGGLW